MFKIGHPACQNTNPSSAEMDKIIQEMSLRNDTYDGLGYCIKWVDAPTRNNVENTESKKPNTLPIKYSHPKVERIIYSSKKTIVIWKDHTKTIVSCSDGEIFDEYDGFTAALAKKIYGSTCAVKREIRKHKQVQDVDKK